MGFTEISSFNFRNLENGSISFNEKTVIFVGENGQGKTNLLEVLYLLCFGSSFRTRKDAQLITHGMKDMSVQGSFIGTSGQVWKIRVVLKGGKKSILLNDKGIQDRARLLSLAPCIVFSHDDIAFVNGPPENQRTFLNQTVSICDPSFIDTLRTYRKLITMRNASLEDGRSDMIDIYDLQLIPCGLEIMKKRKEAVDELNRILTPMYRDISGLDEDIVISYRPSWPGESDDEKIHAFLKEKRPVDIERGLTSTGPHRDRFRVDMGKQDFRSAASTGQMRLLSLVYRVVQAARYVSKTGKPPLLLLDDVLLELDTDKRTRFLENIPIYDQAFFTFLPDEKYERYHLEGKKVYTVSEGRAYML